MEGGWPTWMGLLAQYQMWEFRALCRSPHRISQPSSARERLTTRFCFPCFVTVGARFAIVSELF